jgi:hypothetical protein
MVLRAAVLGIESDVTFWQTRFACRYAISELCAPAIGPSPTNLPTDLL